MAAPENHPDLEFEAILENFSNLLKPPPQVTISLPHEEEEESPEWKKSIVIRFYTGREYTFTHLKEMLNKAWSPSGDFSINEFFNHAYIIKFEYECDRDSVIAGAPWSFNKELLIVEECMKDKTPSEYNFIFSPFWVQFHNLPINALTPNYIFHIASQIGDPIPPIADDVAKWGKFARIRIILDLRKALPLDMEVKLPSGKICLTKLKFERLPNFCYFCVFFGHLISKCPVISRANESIKTSWSEEMLIRLKELQKPRYSDDIRANFIPKQDRVLNSPIHLRKHKENDPVVRKVELKKSHRKLVFEEGSQASSSDQIGSPTRSQYKNDDVARDQQISPKRNILVTNGSRDTIVQETDGRLNAAPFSHGSIDGNMGQASAVRSPMRNTGLVTQHGSEGNTKHAPNLFESGSSRKTPNISSSIIDITEKLSENLCVQQGQCISPQIVKISPALSFMV